jgi:glutamine cyclotransferase
VAFEDDSLFYGFLMALPTNRSKPFVRATHDLLKLVPDVVRTFFDKVVVFSRGLSSYGEQIFSTAGIEENACLCSCDRETRSESFTMRVSSNC